VTPLFSKLNLGEHRTIHVLGAPASFELELGALHGVRVERRALDGLGFAIAFVITAAQRDAACRQLVASAQGDAVLWIAYPKSSSKAYRCEFNRDSGWPVLGAGGYEPVRQVAIDRDWSALRFRKAEHIRKISRHPDGAISPLGRQRARAHEP
jgi:hypothetical protein